MDEYLAKLERLTDAREYIGTAIYAGADIVANSIRAQINALPVGLLICLTVIAFNFVGDGLRDALDPKMKR